MNWGNMLSKIADQWHHAIAGKSLEEKRRECEIELYKVKVGLETQIAKDKRAFYDSNRVDQRAKRRLEDATLGLMLVEQLSRDIRETVEDARLNEILEHYNDVQKKGNRMAGLHPVFQSGSFQKGMSKLNDRMTGGDDGEVHDRLRPYKAAATRAAEQILDPSNEFDSDCVGSSVKNALYDMENGAEDVWDMERPVGGQTVLRDLDDADVDRFYRQSSGEQATQEPEKEGQIGSKEELDAVKADLRERFM